MPITTLLFDLDDTLLGNNMDVFIQPYLKSFAGHVADLVEPNTFVSGLLAGTQAMMANSDPARTLEESFYQRFYRDVPVERSVLQPVFEGFYAEKFPALRQYTTTVTAAPAAVEWALGQNLKVVIATNALFPRVAIEQRLDWAGVSPQRYPYALVTTIEFMHFAKPHPEYFAEILAWVDSRPEETLMIGNDWSQDIEPAAAAGLHTYWVKAEAAPAPADGPQPTGAGSLADFVTWVKSGALNNLPPRPLAAAGVRALQAGQLAALVEMTRDLKDSAWAYRPAADEWSLTEIACHLRDTELEINLPRLQTILNEPNAFISAVESDPWAAERGYAAQSGPEALSAFVRARRDKLAVLDGLTPEDWSRPARHAIFGPTDLRELVALTGEHDRLHLRQARANLRSAL